MADASLAVTVGTAEPLSRRRARILRRIEKTRSGIAVEWSELEHAVADGQRRSHAMMASVRTGARWALALAALWALTRRRDRLTWPRAAFLAAVARAAGKQLIRHWFGGERHVEP